MGQAKKRGSFEERKAKAEKVQGRICKIPPYGSMRHVPFQVSQEFLDKQQVAQLQARKDKRFCDERDIYLQVLLAFSEPFDLKLGDLDIIIDRFKSKTKGVLWIFRGDFLDCSAITVFDSAGIPHVVINAEAHQTGDGGQQVHELFDSLTHEMTHATGPLLGRWTIDQQPNLSNLNESVSNTLTYAIEEFVAITTAVNLYSDQLGFSKEQSDEIRSISIQAVIEQLELTQEIEAQIDWSHIESSSQEAVDFLTHG